ncbi:MAG: excinuclease ABC subunit UvrA [Quinella sp. 3Q1]|nr:excinuclease ABC subunit UvrA [Quinella sp. 3Q1]
MIALIEIIGADENNLKHVDLSIPKNQLVVFAGVSGSGKSSLVFDTIARESSRQWQANYPLFVRNKMPHYERPKVDAIYNLTPSVVINQKPLGASSRSTVGTAIDVAPLIRLLFSRVGKPSAGGSMAYSFNHPAGMCPECTGLGERLELIEESLFDADKTLAEGAILFSQFSAGWQAHLYQNNPLLDPNKKLRDFTADEWKILREGSDKSVKVEIRSDNTGRIDRVDYEGVIPRFNRLYLKRDISKLKKSLQEEIFAHVRHGACSACSGSGLNPAALKSKINGLNIVDYMNLPAADLLTVLKKISDPIGTPLAKQISETLERMLEVGIGYLSMARRTNTLSGGENQRIKIVRNLASSLNNVTYIFDEPTAGLHPADAEKIGKLLIKLRDKKNNILVVEHNPQIISLADYVVELGPLAGSGGGEIVYRRTVDDLRSAKTLTARTLNRKIKINRSPRKWIDGFEIHNAHCHNLKNFDVTIPKNILTAITGVAGSGKSSLACHEFLSRYPDTILIDQKPIGTSIRSTPATYTGAMDEIRKIFAKANGVGAEMFSFNSKGGCHTCKGTGQISFDMAFAEPIVLTCEDCGGRRYNREALGYIYNGLNIEDVMRLTIDRAIKFFGGKVAALLKNLSEVGLGYLTLGQSTDTLSGGEIQRIKLASELNKSGNVYVLDEPSNGLSVSDTEKLLEIFNRLIAGGNTVIIIEHKLELIAQADWIIDLGKGGGSQGGEIIFSGTPEEILTCRESKTGQFLKALT